MEYPSKEMKKKFMESAKGWSKEKDKEEAKKANKEALAMKRLTAKEEKSKTHEAKKDEIKTLLNNLWLDEDKGIETKDALFRAAKKVEPLTTTDDINEFLRKEPTEQVKDTPGYNSWVGSLPR